VLVTEGHGPAQRLAEMLRGEGIGARLADLDDPPEPGVPYVTTGGSRTALSGRRSSSRC
jgi:transcription-repair coupling factor (superfamily II helicase)